MVGGAKSSTCITTSGVSQVSVLGPILFLVYMNDITINIHSEIRLFADDILLCRTSRLPNDHRILQEDLKTLTKWADDWTMEFKGTMRQYGSRVISMISLAVKSLGKPIQIAHLVFQELPI